MAYPERWKDTTVISVMIFIWKRMHMMTSVMNLVMPLKQISMKKQRTEIIENNSKITRSYNIAQIRPSVTRYTTNEVDDKNFII